MTPTTRAMARRLRNLATQAYNTPVSNRRAAAVGAFAGSAVRYLRNMARRNHGSSGRPAAPRRTSINRIGPKVLGYVGGSGQNEALVKIQGKRVAKKRRGAKRVKVSRSLRKKIKQTLRLSSPSGYYTERYFNKYKPTDFFQNIVDLGSGWTVTENGSSGGVTMFFDPVRVLDAASVLFNNKAPIGNKDLLDPKLFSATMFNVDVIKQWVKLDMKNNTARTLTLKLWTWEIKNMQETNQQFSAEWFGAASKDASVADGKLNVLSATPSDIGMTPLLHPRMRHLYNIEEKDVVIEPGKSYVHLVQGPSRVYDYAKFWKNAGSFNNFQKGNKGVCMALFPDVVSTGTGGAGVAQRYTDITASDPYGLLVETTYSYVIRLPDQTGFQITGGAAGTEQPLYKRRNGPFAVKIWNQVAQVGTVFDVEDENPQAPATSGV